MRSALTVLVSLSMLVGAVFELQVVSTIWKYKVCPVSLATMLRKEWKMQKIQISNIYSK